MPGKPIEIGYARAELVVLVLASRADWTEGRVEDALTRASVSGITWPQALAALPRLAAIGAEPEDLVPPEHSLSLPKAVPPPETAHRGAALARQLSFGPVRKEAA